MNKCWLYTVFCTLHWLILIGFTFRSWVISGLKPKVSSTNRYPKPIQKAGCLIYFKFCLFITAVGVMHDENSNRRLLFAVVNVLKTINVRNTKHKCNKN